MAWDFVVFDGTNENGGTGDALWESPDMRKAGAIAIEQGLDWGGAWQKFKDVPHIQLSGITVSSLRRSMPKGYLPA
jgi:peptidoglycan L-alanyl-D-glutamate endopeptidase CwlK